jgi:hypothetical protein
MPERPSHLGKMGLLKPADPAGLQKMLKRFHRIIGT